VASDLAVFGAIIVLLGWLRPDIVFPLIYLLLYPLIFITGRRTLLPRLLLASACSLVWMLIGGGIYGYRDLYYSIGPISIYPLAAWAVGFFLADLFATHLRRPRSGVAARFFAYASSYWFILILYETVAYHAYGIRNPATLGYPGLPLCDCIHAPRWVQVTYLSMGPVYFGLAEWFGLNRRSR
jgi:hypothetical protein